ncbi:MULTISPECIES: response regulator transcription factor [Rhizobium]|uniref:response regulator transcription factor n=1 Tax=Rhizobium TaxID=379 RepID=UPI001AEE8530|nr:MULTISPECIES: response regulator [Rhizobium]UFS85637.1 response regulator [Rhizobium sp. T136]
MIGELALPLPTILIVEESAQTRDAAVNAITAAGFYVADASNGDDALRILQGDHDIGLVFTSINMTGKIDGLGLAVRIHRDWPKLAIVMTSAVVELRQSSLPERCRFLKKPYRMEDAIRCFRLLL